MPELRDPITLDADPFSVGVIGRFALGTVVLIVLGVALGAPLADATPVTAEFDLLAGLAAWRTGGSETVLRTLSGVANFWIVLSVVSALAVLLWLTSRSWQSSLLVVVTLFGALGVTGFVKLGVDRARPDEGVVSVLSSSFPSGHAVRGTAIYLLIAWFVWHRWPSSAVRWPVGVVAVLLVVGIGLSRMGLGVHWPTDVVVGHLLGVAWLWLTLRLLRPRVEAGGEAELA